MTNPLISVKHLKKDFGGNEVLKDINGDIDAGQVVCIIGPSGSGKSTLLRCINQLERPTSGVVDFNGVDLAQQSDQELAKLGEQIGMVFQSFNLFPNMSVLANLKLAPMRVKGMSDEEATAVAMKYLTSVGLADKADAFPNSLSGGQKQRVAIARALAMQPKVLFFDEPTSALDPENVGEVLKVMQSLADGNMTMVVVTHEMHFAKQVADEIWFMADGIIQEKNTPDELFDNPQNPKTQDFISKVLVD
ncbi:ABC-type polar amino acid transport system [Fructobacillus tropaeoli]|uniref:amino acid ABC transporter ATP-binding protein n=1 Tax=Fructobacillus tropaeoli TaxID=709323 RepID=UPI002DA23D1C|nr:ABC-type polar amino acid transport system [Fructobacillus tropaeoli]